MSYLRPQHVFYLLMGTSFVSAFVVPARYSARFEPKIQWLFVPVSRPVASIASSLRDRFAPPVMDDRRAQSEIKFENQQLRSEVAFLQTQLEELNRREGELDKLGEVKRYCRLFEVVGGDSGTRDSLAIAGSTLEGLKDDQYVLYAGGIVGQIGRAGLGGAQVRLITDPGFKVRVRFVRFEGVDGRVEMVPLKIPAVLAQGMGSGTLAVRALAFSKIGYSDAGQPAGPASETLREGSDYALLYDSECPRVLQGQMIGRVIQIKPRSDVRLFADIRIQPDAALNRLKEVMVMTRENAAAE